MEKPVKKIVIIGASSKIAEECARIWIEFYSVHFFLVGRNESKLQSIKQDLNIKNPKTKIDTYLVDFFDSNEIETLVKKITQESPIDIILIAQGSLIAQSNAEQDIQQCKESMLINAVSPILFAEAFIQNLDLNQKTTLAIIGSIAGDRGRKSNYIYGAAKGMLERYTQGLQHRFAGTHFHICLIKPGPTESPMYRNAPMATSKNLQTTVAKPESVAKIIVLGIESNKELIYAPRIWQLIMIIIKVLPKFIFNKLNL